MLFRSSLENLKSKLKAISNEDRFNPRANADLKTAYSAATWPLRGESLMNTGVLNPGELPMLKDALEDPTGFGGLIKGKDQIIKQIEELQATSNRNTQSIAKSRLPEPPPGMDSSPAWVKMRRFANEENNSQQSDPFAGFTDAQKAQFFKENPNYGK